MHQRYLVVDCLMHAHRRRQHADEELTSRKPSTARYPLPDSWSTVPIQQQHFSVMSALDVVRAVCDAAVQVFARAVVRGIGYSASLTACASSPSQKFTAVSVRFTQTQISMYS